MSELLDLKAIEARALRDLNSGGCEGWCAEQSLALLAALRETREALRRAPMPERESTLKDDDWYEAYDKWWHENAAEAAMLAKVRDE